MSGQSACGERPVLLMTQYKRRSEFAEVVFVLVIFLQEQHRHYSGLVVGDVSLRVRGIIGVNAVRVDARNPVRVVLRFAHFEVQFYSNRVNGVHAPDAIGYREDNSVILLGSPLLKIVPEIPDNVRIIPVTGAEELTVLLATIGSVHQRSLCPAPLVERGKQAL